MIGLPVALDLVRRSGPLLAIGLLIAVLALTYQTIRAAALSDSLDDAHAQLSTVRQERDQLRGIIARNNAAVQALRFEREAIEADFVQLREQIEDADDASCIDAVNRALGQ